MWPPSPQQALIHVLLLLLTLRVRLLVATRADETASLHQVGESQGQNLLLAEYPELSVLKQSGDVVESVPPRRRHEAARRATKPDELDGPLIHANVKFYVHKKRSGEQASLSTPLPHDDDDKNDETRASLALACLEALERLLQYFTANTDQLIADGFLGVAMAQGQLDTALQLESKEARALRPLLERLRVTCEQILSAAQPMIDSGMPSQVQGVQKLLGPEYWRGSPAGSRGPLGVGRVPHWPLSPLPPMSGTPDEVTSDQCLGQLLSETDCSISEDCWLAESAGTAMGYSLTHRLMFLQTARKAGCVEKVNDRTEQSLDEMISNACADIHAETRAIAARDYPENLRDLLLEQVTLCGAEGYLEFAEKSLVRSMLQWQRADGCYGVDVFRRSKRSEQPMGDAGCLVHYTAVAAGALATSARLLLSEPH
ncbi:hypothetical protein B566_EDAN014900 [Ephemera danica]|nr:hypothetical protein B566_EDAN014900 [Ephemera danica]